MTDEQINKAIAEYIGYKPLPIGWNNPPNYCGDLNAMESAKNFLTGDKRIDFIDNLCEVVKQDKNISAGPYSVMTQAFYATAKQQAIAFLKTIGKLEL